jgi:formylglycine-generating enzyme required for sulfatase activity
MGIHLIRIICLALSVLPLLFCAIAQESPAVQHLEKKPEWASIDGVDQYGQWVEMDVSGSRQRFRWVYPGTFMMGSPQSEQESAMKGRAKKVEVECEVLHIVTLSRGYWIADSTCTQSMWQIIEGKNPSFHTGDSQLPVEQVSWDDVQLFIEDLNLKVHGQFRLPTEAQWEYACRAGTRGEYAGPSLDLLGWYRNNSDGVSHVVRGKLPNAWGLYDIHGNVGEWCLDWFGDYSTRPALDPEGPSNGTERVNRGGCWVNDAWVCRSAKRSHLEPNNQRNRIGFRLLSLQ